MFRFLFGLIIAFSLLSIVFCQENDTKKEEEKAKFSAELTKHVLDPWFPFPIGSYVKLTTKSEDPHTQTPMGDPSMPQDPKLQPKSEPPEFVESYKIKSKKEFYINLEMITMYSKMEPTKAEAQFSIVDFENFMTTLVSDLRASPDTKPEYKGLEELTFGESKIQCHAFVINSKSDMSQSTSVCKIWLSKDVPKGIAKKVVNINIKFEGYEESIEEFYELKEFNKSITIANKKITASTFEHIINKKTTQTSEKQTIKLTLSNDVPGKVVIESSKVEITQDSQQPFVTKSEKKATEFSVPGK